MAYMNQESKKVISEKVKPILEKYKVKATLSVENYSTIVLKIASGPIDFINNFNETRETKSYESQFKYVAKDYIQVNEYHYREHFSGKALQFLSEVIPAMYSADWYDNSDAMTDYFDTAYYVDVLIGKWDKPYQLISSN